MIIITGATGYIGKNLVKAANPENIRSLVRKGSNTEGIPQQTIIEADLLDPSSLEKALEEGATVVHLAALTHAPTREAFAQVNIEGTKNLIEACKKKNVKRIIFISSMATTRKFLDDYGWSKKEAEELIKTSGLDYTILRLTTVYGPDSPFIKTMVQYIKKIPSIIPIIGNGEAKIQPVAIEDVVLAIQKCIENPKAIGKTYAILGGTKISFNYFIDLLCSRLNIKKKKVHIPIHFILLGMKLGKPFKTMPFKEEFIKAFDDDIHGDNTEAERDLNIKFKKLSQGFKI